MEEEEEGLVNGHISPSSSSSSTPPTPPSPLPISVAPGNRKYSFSSSPSPSPPFSAPPSSLPSGDDLPLPLETLSTPAQVPSAFSLDRSVPDDDRTSCIKELVDWFIASCCCCFSWCSQIFDQRKKQD